MALLVISHQWKLTVTFSIVVIVLSLWKNILNNKLSELLNVFNIYLVIRRKTKIRNDVPYQIIFFIYEVKSCNTRFLSAFKFVSASKNALLQILRPAAPTSATGTGACLENWHVCNFIFKVESLIIKKKTEN